MRNNPYNKNLKDHLPLFMQGPSSISALISNEAQKNFVEKAKQLPNPKMYTVQNVSFAMVSPPVLNEDLTANPPDLLKKEMGQTEVTQELFQAVMGWEHSVFEGSGKLPVELVTWYDCIDFCNKLSTVLGFEECYRIFDKEMNYVHIRKAKVEWDESKNGFRLPTEKEWEFFAKAGTDNQWSGTNKEVDFDQYAWYDKNSNRKTHPVGDKLPNEWGLYDMSGNVWEWCWDLYNPEDGHRRVVRGGSFGNDADLCRVARRNGHPADDRGINRGFRLCRSIG